MALTEFLIKGADNSELQISVSELPKTVAFADLTPMDGTLPSFTVAPLVFIETTGSDGFLDVKSVTTTNFQIVTALLGADNSFVVSVRIVSEEPVADAPSVATAVAFPYYCSVNDVLDANVNLKQSHGSGETRRHFAAPLFARRLRPIEVLEWIEFPRAALPNLKPTE